MITGEQVKAARKLLALEYPQILFVRSKREELRYQIGLAK